jgi:UDP-N-acetyl-D-glucosamine dehydrogenase
MPQYVVDKVRNALNEHCKPLKGSKMLVMGIAYKRDIDDVRESPVLDIIHLLNKRGAIVSYCDPFVPHIRPAHEHGIGFDMTSVDPCQAADADCAVIVTDHKSFDYKALVRDANLMLDTRNALKGIESENIFRL